MGYYKECYQTLVSLVWFMAGGNQTHNLLIRNQVPYSARFGYIVNHCYFGIYFVLHYYSWYGIFAIDLMSIYCLSYYTGHDDEWDQGMFFFVLQALGDPKHRALKKC